MKSLDPLRVKKIFIRKKLGHTAVSAIKPHQGQKEPVENIVVSKTDISLKIPKYFKFV